MSLIDTINQKEEDKDEIAAELFELQQVIKERRDEIQKLRAEQEDHAEDSSDWASLDGQIRKLKEEKGDLEDQIAHEENRLQMVEYDIDRCWDELNEFSVRADKWVRSAIPKIVALNDRSSLHLSWPDINRIDRLQEGRFNLPEYFDSQDDLQEASGLKDIMYDAWSLFQARSYDFCQAGIPYPPEPN